jgi:hypothetical protein
MRKVTLVTIALAGLSGLAGAAQADTYVNGYVRRDGTYVRPHYRTDPDSTKLNNYSTQGNVNPYTGQRGTVNPFATNNSFGTSNTYGGSRRRW